MTTCRRCILPWLCCWLLGGRTAWLRGSPIAPAGQELTRILDSMHVERLWLAGAQVNWRTGLPNGKVYAVPKGHTHCSAFAAAAAEKLGVYLLRPPQHSATLLANAQQDWLRAAGTNDGWYAVRSALEAQQLANAGELVLVTCKNPDPKLPGHVAIVRPSEKSDEKILAEGPQITQAGLHNFISISTKAGFKSHAGAFENHQLLYFAHKLSLPNAGLRIRISGLPPDLPDLPVGLA